MRKQQPDMVQGLTSNPFPDAEKIVPARADDIAKVASFFHHGQDGVQTTQEEDEKWL